MKAEGTGRTGVLPLFSIAALTSAFLLFWAEPLFARFVLPLLGGSAAVWNTCLMYFQIVLLAGYLYAHLSSRYLSARKQVILHVALLCVCLIALPLAIPRGWTPPASSNVVPWLLTVLSVSVGAPFLVLSATAPLLQRWYADASQPLDDPYILYAASNAGSFLGLLAFPLILEPHLRLGQQSRLWALVYLFSIAAIGGCGLMVWKRLPQTTRPAGADEERATPPGWDERAKWISLAFIPSSLLLGVTTFLSTDIAATPLLWAIPLSLYLLTFVAVFGKDASLVAVPAAYLHALLITALSLVFFFDTRLGFRPGYALHLSVFAVTALVLHGELAASRPAPRYLTTFYLWIALGGALGGAFTALIVPIVFKSTRDYWMMLVIACFFRPSAKKIAQPYQILFALVPGMILATVHRPDLASRHIAIISLIALGSGIVAVVTLAMSRNALRFGLAIAGIVGTAMFFQQSHNTIFSDRSFFGIYKVEKTSGPANILFHGSTVHGAQLRTPLMRRMPLTYYHPNGPVGQVFQSLQRDLSNRSIGIVGLGTGSILCYSKLGEDWTFFEIDPHVERIARDGRLFTYLSECAVQPHVVIGDARVTMAREPSGRYSILVLDAFSSDAIPIHLLTREALQIYRRLLTDRGLLLVHISNRRLDLEPVVEALARDSRMPALIRNFDVVSKAQDARFEYSSDWVVIGKRSDAFAPLLADKRWRPLKRGSPDQLWTDDYSNLLSVIKW